MKWGLRRVQPAAAVTTHANPHARQQPARDLEVERVAMGQRCRPHRIGEVQRGNSSAPSMAGFPLNRTFPAVQLQDKQSPSLDWPVWKFKDGLGTNIRIN